MNLFLESTGSSLILHNLSYLDFNDVPIICFVLLNFTNYLPLPPMLYMLGVFAHLYQKFVSVSFVIFTTPYL